MSEITPALDEAWMREALAWAERGKGWTSPRPSVGCVLVRDGQIIGGGHTQNGDGQPHAEVMALRQAHEAFPALGVRGATAYVTLEPCSHWGTTPPCSEALIREGVARVVCGVTDPNPLIAGRGLLAIKAAGIPVVLGVLAQECQRTHEDFLKCIVEHRAFVTLKTAVSLDGKIALKSGESRWITGTAARERAHRLRHTHDGVLVGIGTVLADNPSLSVRLEGRAKQPARIVLDSQGRLPLDAKIWDDAPQIIVVTSQSLDSGRAGRLADKGAVLLPVASTPSGLDWTTLLDGLFSMGICSVLIEGGGRVAGSALAAGVVDKVCAFVAPLLVGEGLSALGGYEIGALADAPRLRQVWHESLGEDVLVSGYLTDLPDNLLATKVALD